MPIQQREVYATIWKGLSTDKQETVVKTAVNKIDEFNSICFVDMDKNLEEISANKQLNLLNPLEKIFRLVLTLSKVNITAPAQLKTYCFDKIMDIHKNVGPSNFIWTAIACSVKDAFKLEHFFMNLMIQQLDDLYFKTYVINELDNDKEDEKKKLKKKNKRKRKHKNSAANKRMFNSFAEDSDKIEKAEHKSQVSNKTETLSYTANTDGGTGADRLGLDFNVENNLPCESLEPNKQISTEGDKLSVNDDVISEKRRKTKPKIATNTPINKDSVNDTAEQQLKVKKNSTFMKKESKVQERYNDDSIKITDEKLSSLNNYILVDEQEKHLLNEQLKLGFNSQLTIENSDDEQRYTNNSQNHEKKMSKFKKTGFTNFNKFSEYGFREKKPISCIDKDPFIVGVEKRTSSTDFHKKQEFNQRYRNIEECNSISINKTISTKTDARRIKGKKDPKYIDMNIPFDLNEINMNNSEVEEDGYCATPIDSKRNHLAINDEYQRNKSTEHSKKYYGNSKLGQNVNNNTSKLLNRFSKIETMPKKPKLKKVGKEPKPNTEKKINSHNLDKNEPNVKDTNTKQATRLKKASNTNSVKNKQTNNQTTKAEPNASIKAISYWKDEPSLVMNMSPDKPNNESVKSATTIEKDLEENGKIKKTSRKKKEKFKLRKKGVIGENTAQTIKKQNAPLTAPGKNSSNEEKDDKSVKLKGNHTNSKFSENRDKNNERPESKELTIKRVFTEIMDEHLDSVINDLEQHTRSLDEGRSIIHERISSIVERTFQGSGIYIQEYGSYATRLLTPYSDMDLSIQGCIILDREQAIEMLQVVCDNLKLFGFITNATPILTALVPVIKVEADPSIEFEDNETTKESLKIKVDIIVDLLDNYNPVSTALRTTDYIKHCISTYPSFYKNMLFLKFALNCNDMTNTYQGGLNAYSLCVMYVAYIEFFNIEKSTEQFETLHGFLRFFSTQFDPETQAIFFGTAFR